MNDRNKIKQDEVEDNSTPREKESEQVKNANAAGDGAMERKDTELIQEDHEKKPVESNY